MIRRASSGPLRRYAWRARPAGKETSSQHRWNSSIVRSFSGELLHVEVQKDVPLGSRLQDRPQGGRQAPQRALEVDRVGPRMERADLDGNVSPGYLPQVVRLQTLPGRPGGKLTGEGGDQVQVAILVDAGLGVAEAGLAQQVEARGHARLPAPAELGQGRGEVVPDDEVAGHGPDLGRDSLGQHTLGQRAHLQPELQPRRQLDVGPIEVFDQALVDLGRRLQHGKGVDEAEQLHLEARVAHGPSQQAVRPEPGREHACALFPRRGEQFASDLAGPLFEGYQIGRLAGSVGSPPLPAPAGWLGTTTVTLPAALAGSGCRWSM